MQRRRARGTRAVAALAGMTCTVVLGMAGSAYAASSVLSGSGVAVLGATSGTVAASSQTLSFEVWLAPDEAGASRFADAASTPGSPTYHQWLSPDAYTARFGPTAAEANAVVSWLRSQGMADVHASAQRDYVSATGTVGGIDAAFGVQMRTYQTADANGSTTTVESNDRDLSIPASLTADVLAVTGLNNTQPVTEHTAPVASSAATAADCSQYWAQRTATLSPEYDGLNPFALAVCGYSAEQLRAAYGMTDANTGVGQTIALIEIGQPTDMFGTLTDYAAANGLPAPTSTQLRQEVIGQGGACGNEFDIEEQLDSEASYAMAPGADQLMVEGDSCNQALEGDQALFDADTAVLGGNGASRSATIVSNSWELGGETLPPMYVTTAHAIDLRAAAEGVGMYFSSGDGPGIEVPSSDPYSTAVGGTTLGVGATDDRLFETGWSDDNAIKQGGAWTDLGIQSGAGGGTSLLYPEPSYQHGVVPPSMAKTSAGRSDRAVPDISADADPFSGMLIGTIEPKNNGQAGPYTTFVIGGTSESSPLVAGMVADAQQGQASSFGFINPLLYSVANTRAYHPTLPFSSSTPDLYRGAFLPAALDKGSPPCYPIPGEPANGIPCVAVFDDQDPTMTAQVTAPGYDTMTGVGTPNGTAFINALRSGH